MRNIHIYGLLSALVLLSSCATIVGGANYYAHVTVQNRPNAQIIYNDRIRGQGHASFKVKRINADKLTIVVQEEGFPAQKYNYTTRTFRGWALVGSLVVWTFKVKGSPILIPAGILVDLATGAVWKPNVHEMGVFKKDYKNFKYIIDYNPSPIVSK